MTDPTCDTHPGLTADLRTMAVTALDRLAPALERLAAAPEAAAQPSTCAVCPVCAVLAALRGERSELAVRLAEQLTGLLTVLRAALDEGDPVAAAAGSPTGSPTGAPPADPPPARTNGRVVQQIPIERPGR